MSDVRDRQRADRADPLAGDRGAARRTSASTARDGTRSPTSASTGRASRDEPARSATASTLEIGQLPRARRAGAAGAHRDPPQRTESLARELCAACSATAARRRSRSSAARVAGAKRALAPPESTLVIGRGDEASWIIADDDLSRAHAEIRRGWDGVRDRRPRLEERHEASTATPSVDGGTPLRDGASIELGKVVLRFRDPAERHLRGELAPATERTPSSPIRPATSLPRARLPSLPPVVAPPAARTSPLFWVALAVAGVAIGGLAWILAS